MGIGIQRAGIDQGLGTAGMGSDVAATDGGAVEVILREDTCREGRHGLGVNSAWQQTMPLYDMTKPMGPGIQASSCPVFGKVRVSGGSWAFMLHFLLI